MFGLEFLKTIFSRVPLKWVGYKYFIQFMNAVDPKLLKSPVYNSDIKLESKFSVNYYEAKYRLQFIKNHIKALIKDKIPVSYDIYKSYHNLKSSTSKNNNSIIISQQNRLMIYYNMLYHSSNIFDITTINKKLFRFEGDDIRLVTLLFYLKEVEKRFIKKIKL